jgi:hypothetical protein
MVLGDYFIEDLLTVQGTTIKAEPIFVEPVTDICLLGALDDQEFPDEVDAYKTWCEQTTPIAFCQRDFPFNTPVPVQVYTHLGEWINGTVQQMHYEAMSLACCMGTQIIGGTSGSPIITADGLIVGVVSHFTQTGHDCRGLTPRPHLTLPVWALRQSEAHENTDGLLAAARMAWYGIL